MSTIAQTRPKQPQKKPLSTIKHIWAWDQKTGSSAAKLVLIALARHANMQMLAFPSITCLAKETELNRKTVITVLAKLIDLELIKDTGYRVGLTKQVVVYKLQIDESLYSTAKDTIESSNNTKLDTVEEKTAPFLPQNSPVFSVKQFQKRDTEKILNNIEDISNLPLTPSYQNEDEVIRVTPTATEEKPSVVKSKYPQDSFWKIAKIYEEILPDASPVKDISYRIQIDIHNLERDCIKGEAGWREYFATVVASDYLTGKIDGFKVSFIWLLKRENYAKVVNGRYVNKGRRGTNGENRSTGPHTDSRGFCDYTKVSIKTPVVEDI